MPRVTPEYLAARRRQILEAATRCFIQKGFHQTSMADVLAEAGLSAGAVYRYFPSKDAIVAAIAEEAVSQVSAGLEHVLAEDPPPPLDEVIGRIATVADQLSGPEGLTRIAVQVWAEALHNETLGRVVRDVITRLRAQFVEIARRARDADQLPSDADLDQVAFALLAFAPGFILQRLLIGDVRPDTYQAGVRALLAGGRVDRRG
jgi:AcrR family transcriptional regulator